jgi:hypothetical protein
MRDMLKYVRLRMRGAEDECATLTLDVGNY